jgi:hypothetical protein
VRQCPRRSRQQADAEGGATHDQNRDQESVFTAYHVAEATEYQRAERTDDKAGGNASKAKMNAVFGSVPAKNCLAMMAASEPYR